MPPSCAMPPRSRSARTAPVHIRFHLYIAWRTVGAVASKTERLSLRLTPEQDAILRRAADARGESANEFVVRHAVEAAQMELADRRVFVADDSAWGELLELLSRPPALPPAMLTLLSNPSVLEAPA
jgi:uncharacterized protein (DUF1778 family)